MAGLVDYDLSGSELEDDDDLLLEDAAEEAAEDAQMEEDNRELLRIMEAAAEGPMIGPRRGPLTTAPLARAEAMATQKKVNPFAQLRKKPNNSGDAPTLAAHERDRRLPQKAPAGPRGRQASSRKTPEPKMSAEARIKTLAHKDCCGKYLTKPLVNRGARCKWRLAGFVRERALHMLGEAKAVLAHAPPRNFDQNLSKICNESRRNSK